MLPAVGTWMPVGTITIVLFSRAVRTDQSMEAAALDTQVNLVDGFQAGKLHQHPFGNHKVATEIASLPASALTSAVLECTTLRTWNSARTKPTMPFCTATLKGLVAR